MTIPFSGFRKIIHIKDQEVPFHHVFLHRAVLLQSPLLLSDLKNELDGQTLSIHQTKTIQKLRSCSKSAPNPRYCRSLMQSQRSRDIQYFIHLCFRRTCHSSPRISRKRLQITSGALCIQNSQCQRRFPPLCQVITKKNCHFLQNKVYVGFTSLSTFLPKLHLTPSFA